jgi:hypothetical protein
MKTCVQLTVTILVAMFLSGCVNPCTVMTGARTPADFGNIKVYGTDNVPFEYDEIGFHCVVVDADQQTALRTFATQTQNMGADAILNFHIRPVYATGGFFFVMSDTSQYEVSGVAVKIKRP